MVRWSLCDALFHGLGSRSASGKRELYFAQEQFMSVRRAFCVIQNHKEGFLEIQKMECYVFYPFAIRECVCTSLLIYVRLVPLIRAFFECRPTIFLP